MRNIGWRSGVAVADPQVAGALQDQCAVRCYVARNYQKDDLVNVPDKPGVAQSGPGGNHQLVHRQPAGQMRVEKRNVGLEPPDDEHVEIG